MFLTEEPGAASQAIISSNAALVLGAEAANRCAASCVTARLRAVVRLHVLLAIHQLLPHSPAQMPSSFACAVILRDKAPATRAYSHLKQFVPCPAEGMGSHASGAAQQQRGEGGIPAKGQ